MSIAWCVHSHSLAKPSATNNAGCLPAAASSRQSTFCADWRTFGFVAAVALAELSPDIAALNRLYRKLVSGRQLLRLPEIADWRGRRVSVFLRHSDVSVFAIHCSPGIGMSNMVILNDAVFVVDQTGHQQTLLKKGPLENQSSVHAFVTGTLVSVSDSVDDNLRAKIPGDFLPVIYRPELRASFLVGHTDPPLVPQGIEGDPQWLPVSAASQVVMIPGRQKVWCSDPVSCVLPELRNGKLGQTDWPPAHPTSLAAEPSYSLGGRSS